MAPIVERTRRADEKRAAQEAKRSAQAQAMAAKGEPQSGYDPASELRVRERLAILKAARAERAALRAEQIYTSKQ